MASLARRADIDGLRAFAIVLVVVYHVWVGRVSGGVDVFLLVSAYLMTRSLLARHAEIDGAFLGRFWVRRFAQLVPPAAITVLGVLVLAAAIFPTSTWPSIWSQSFASLFFAQNGQLSAEAVDYYARAQAFPSPLLHFWSLSVQGQVFVLWPVAIAICVWVARRCRADPRRVLLVFFSIVFIASFVRSLVFTASDQQLAYFETWSRLWEFALGSLLAIVAPWLRIGARAGVALAWTGLVGMLLCGMVLDVESGFPGAAALWPTVCAVLLLLAGQAPAKSTPVRFLQSPPMVRLGKIAYSLYLVHWPVLIGVLVLTDSASVSFLGGVVVIVVSLALAVALRAGVERVWRMPRPSIPRTLAVTLAWSLIVLVPLLGWQAAERVRAGLADPAPHPGAAVLLPRNAANVIPGAAITPDGTEVQADWVELEGPCAGTLRPDDSVLASTCTEKRFGDVDAPTALVIGDSHVQQWLGGLLPVLEEDGWNVVALMKGGCFFAPGEAEEVDDACRDWDRKAAVFAEEFPAEVIVMMGSRAVAEQPDERLPRGMETRVVGIADSGSEVLLIRDNPRFDIDMYQCVEQHGRDSPECTRPRSQVSAEINPASALAELDRVHAIDLLDYLCPAGVCRPVIGNVAVYLDGNHLTGTYARSMAPAMRDALTAIPGIALG